MNCVVLTPSAAQAHRAQLAIEDLGESWRCFPFLQPEPALRCLRDSGADLLLLFSSDQRRDLLTLLMQNPLLAPPYVLCDTPLPGVDGPIPPPDELISLLPGWEKAGRLPVLSLLRLEEAACLAHGLLQALEIPRGLGAWRFLPDMAALTAVHPRFLSGLSYGLYPLVARRHGMTAAAVERSLRLCVEATWNRASLSALERFFGHSVDPERGKPTNREFLCRVQERVTLAAARLSSPEV